MRKIHSMVLTGALAGLGLAASLQMTEGAPLTAWAPVPVKLAPFTAPNKPLKKFVDILARHRGKSDWAETEVLTRDFIGQYVSMGAGKKTKTLFWADDRIYLGCRVRPDAGDD